MNSAIKLTEFVTENSEYVLNNSFCSWQSVVIYLLAVIISVRNSRLRSQQTSLNL